MSPINLMCTSLDFGRKLEIPRLDLTSLMPFITFETGHSPLRNLYFLVGGWTSLKLNYWICLYPIRTPWSCCTLLTMTRAKMFIKDSCRFCSTKLNCHNRMSGFAIIHLPPRLNYLAHAQHFNPRWRTEGKWKLSGRARIGETKENMQTQNFLSSAVNTWC